MANLAAQHSMPILVIGSLRISCSLLKAISLT